MRAHKLEEALEEEVAIGIGGRLGILTGLPGHRIEASGRVEVGGESH